MSKNKAVSGGDRKGERVSEGEPPRMITSQTATSGLPTRPALALQAPGHAYIVQSHHEMKSFNKSASARPIAPAPPSQAVQNLAARNVQSSQANIPTIISSSLGQGSNEGGLVSLNLVTTTASSGLGTVSPSPITLPGTLSQASVLHLGSSAPPGNSPVVQQGIASTTIPINMLRGSGGQQPQPPIPQFAQNFPHLPRGTTTLSVPKSTALLRPGTTPALQLPSGLATGVPALPLPIARPHKTTTVQVTRSPSPAVSSGPTPQAQPQDLSRANFSLHGTINPVNSGTLGGPHPMHITLNRMNTPDAANIQGRTITAQVQNDTPVNVQQRISVSLSSDSNMHHRVPADLARSTLPYSGQGKVTNPNLGPQAKVITTQPGTAIKSVNIAVTLPVIISSISPSQSLPSATGTTSAASSQISGAKVTPQRQHPVGSIPPSSVPVPAHGPTPSLALSASTTSQANPSAISASHATMTVSSLPSLPSSIPSSLPLSVNVGDACSQRHEQTGISSSQSGSSGIIIAPEFQTRPPGSVITMTTLASSVQGSTAPIVVSQAENRSSGQNQQHFDVKPDDAMWLQHYMYQQVSQPPPQIVRQNFTYLPAQGKIQTPNQSLAASQLAAISVASSSNVRFNTGGNLMMVDQLRQQQHQQQHPLHTSFSTGSTTVSGADKAGQFGNLSSRATIASSIYTTSVGVQSQIPGGGGGSGLGANSGTGGLSAVPVTNPSSSPRPSILRKRTSEAAGVVIRKPNFNLTQENRCHSPPRVDTNSTSVSSPKISTKNFSPMSENSQSSTDTALSSNDATTPTQNHTDKVKGDGDECLENGPALSASTVNNIPASPAVSHTGSLSEASPRKRARKQLLHANEELKDNLSSSEEELENNTHRHRKDSLKDHKHKDSDIRGEYTDEEGVRWVLNKPKPTYVLLQPEYLNNKTRNNHFTRYTDVKPKEERRPTVNELSNQRGIMQKVNGWKLYFTASQIEELTEVEKDMQDQFTEVQAGLAQIPTHKINSEEALKIHEMSQANIQRCQLIQTQLTDARAAMLRTLEHKTRIQEIVNKHMSKRPIKKKERT